MQLLQKSKFTLKFDWRKCVFWLGMFFMFLPALTSTNLLQMVLNNRMMSMVPLVSILCMLLSNVKRAGRFKINIFDVLLMGMLFFVVRKNYYASLGNTIPAMNFAAVLLGVYFLQKRDNWIQPMLQALSFVYIIYAFFTIWFYFDRDFYMSRIVPMYPDTARRLIQWYNEGCMAGIVEHYSINGILLANGILVHTAGILNPSEHKILNRTALFLCSIAMLLTGKRGPLLFVALAIFVLYFLYQSNQKNIMKKILTVAGVLIAAGAAVLVLYNTVPQLATFIVRFQETSSAGDVTLGRAKYWDLAYELFSSNAVLGIGWCRFMEFTNTRLGFITHVHNVYLQLLTETGIAGSLVFISWFIGVLTVSISFFVKARRGIIVCSKMHLYHMAFSISMQIFFLAYCMTGNPIYDDISMIPYFVACAIALYYRNRVMQGRRRSINPQA